jgi:hypothetical protein
MRGKKEDWEEEEGNNLPINLVQHSGRAKTPRITRNFLTKTCPLHLKTSF